MISSSPLYPVVRLEASWPGRDDRMRIDAGAKFSVQGDPDARYRYLLWREYTGRAREYTGRAETMLFVMLNPSTAGATNDDATIRRCCDFALRRDYTRIEVVNLFAFRSTDPKRLEELDEPDAIGPANDSHVVEAANRADVIVCAWGALPKWAAARKREVLALLHANGRRTALYCLGLTMNREPRHPVRLPNSTVLEIYRP